jgi:FdrA protein
VSPHDETAVERVDVRPGVYHDSVTLLQVSRTVADLTGVRSAQVAMGTPLNVDVLQGMGFAVPAGAGPNDLLVAVRADHHQALDAAATAVTDALAPSGRRGQDVGSAAEPDPTTTGLALGRSPSPLAVVSVPGPYAYLEALDAVRAGSSVLLFSDNVPVTQEVSLKDAAAEHDVLVMGPDCGTAMIHGVGLGFANAVSPGPVSLIAASGTGAQHLMALLDHAGVGVRHCLGVGGRDLSADVGGRSAHQAVAALAADRATELMVLVSKPADPDVVAALARRCADLGLAVEPATLGAGHPDLTEVAERVITRLGGAVPEWPRWLAETPQPVLPGRALRGLFCGGTLCQEALLVAEPHLGPIRSNVALSPGLALTVTGGGWDCGPSHAMVDFGDDTLTQGRAHPMIDPSLRDDRLATEAADPRVGALLLDVVLGHGSHPDPATGLAAAIGSARRTAAADHRELAVVVSLTGTCGDPQGLAEQAGRLADAGADVYLANSRAAAAAAGCVPRKVPA